MTSQRDRCPVCGADPRKIPGKFCADARLCPDCGHMFAASLPTASELEKVYADYAYDKFHEKPAPQFLEAIIGELIAKFEPFRATGRILDVGFGAGTLLRAARARGWNTFGIELSKAAVDLGRKNAIGEVHHGDFLTHPFPDSSFDVIVMSELIEHLPDPMPFLGRAAAALRRGGMLYLTTPHARGVSGRFLGASWSVMRPPEHLQLFSVASMRSCLSRAGFTESNVYTQSLLPHEIVAAIRGGVSPGMPKDGSARVEKSYKLNAALTTSIKGRIAKRTANLVLRATSLGDSLRVEAIR